MAINPEVQPQDVIELFNFYKKKSEELELANLVLQLKHKSEYSIVQGNASTKILEISQKFEEEKKLMIKNYAKKITELESKIEKLTKKPQTSKNKE